MKSGKLVYIAGPLSKPDPFVNVHKATEAWRWCYEHGIPAICPHWSALPAMILDPKYHTYEVWLEYDFAIVERCDALLRLPGESSGADREVKHAEARGIPVFYDLLGLLAWHRGKRGAK